MDREQRKKSITRKKTAPPSNRARRGGSSHNPGGASEENMVKPFPTQIQFKHNGHRNKFKQMIGKKIVPNKYVSVTSLTEIGLLDEVNLYINRMGWN